MKNTMRFAQIACQCLAVYLGSLALVLFLGQSLRGQIAFARLLDPMPTPTATEPGGGEPPGGCRGCTEGWMTIGGMYGAIECHHPKDPNCPEPLFLKPERDCFEFNGGNISPITGQVCRCATCTTVNRCEFDQLRWMAWCGWEDATHVSGACDITEWADTEVWSYARPARVPPPEVCRWDRDAEKKRMCGINHDIYYACKSYNGCEGVGVWYQHLRYPLRRCNPVVGGHPLVSPALFLTFALAFWPDDPPDTWLPGFETFGRFSVKLHMEKEAYRLGNAPVLQHEGSLEVLGSAEGFTFISRSGDGDNAVAQV